MHETHGRLAAIMFIQITEASDNSREIPVVSTLSMEDRQDLCDHVKSFHGAVVDIRAGELFAHSKHGDKEHASGKSTTKHNFVKHPQSEAPCM